MKNWEKNIRRVTPYTPGEQPDFTDMVKLNTNENPYPPAPGVEKALKSMEADALRLYPDPSIGALVHEIAAFYGLSDQQVFVGVGSDDVLALSFLTFFASQRPILFPDVTYSFYDVWADLFGIPYERIPLDANFRIRAEDYKRENGGIIFPNPNAPTGVELEQTQIEEILQANPDVVVIVDEAYVDFGAQSALPLLKKYENLLIVQTFSKSRSMAGMRIGYALGNPALIRCLCDVKYAFNSYTLSRPAILAGVEAVRDRAWFDHTREEIMKTRAWVGAQLQSLGFTFPPSKTNFLFVTHEKVSAKDLYEALREAHIFVRYFPKPRTANHLRITIGTPEQMQTLLDFLIRYLSS